MIPTNILVKYFDYVDIFPYDLTIKLSYNSSIIKHIIKLVKGKQLSYKYIYALFSRIKDFENLY